MDDDTKAHLSDRTVWARLLYMLFFFIAYGIAEFIAWVVALFQAVSALITGSANQTLLVFGNNLTEYVRQILAFVTFNSEDIPFPFSDWPDEGPADGPWQEDDAPVASTPAAPVEETPAPPASQETVQAEDSAASDEGSTASEGDSDTETGSEEPRRD